MKKRINDFVFYFLRKIEKKSNFSILSLVSLIGCGSEGNNLPQTIQEDPTDQVNTPVLDRILLH